MRLSITGQRRVLQQMRNKANCRGNAGSSTYSSKGKSATSNAGHFVERSAKEPTNGATAATIGNTSCFYGYAAEIVIIYCPEPAFQKKESKNSICHYFNLCFNNLHFTGSLDKI